MATYTGVQFFRGHGVYTLYILHRMVSKHRQQREER